MGYHGEAGEELFVVYPHFHGIRIRRKARLAFFNVLMTLRRRLLDQDQVTEGVRSPWEIGWLDGRRVR